MASHMASHMRPPTQPFTRPGLPMWPPTQPPTQPLTLLHGAWPPIASQFGLSQPLNLASHMASHMGGRV